MSRNRMDAEPSISTMLRMPPKHRAALVAIATETGRTMSSVLLDAFWGTACRDYPRAAEAARQQHG